MFALPESPSDGRITGLSNQQMQTTENNIIGGPLRGILPGPDGSYDTKQRNFRRKCWIFKCLSSFSLNFQSLNSFLGFALCKKKKSKVGLPSNETFFGPPQSGRADAEIVHLRGRNPWRRSTCASNSQAENQYGSE